MKQNEGTKIFLRHYVIFLFLLLTRTFDFFGMFFLLMRFKLTFEFKGFLTPTDKWSNIWKI